MALYRRKDSKFWYFWLEGTKIRENTKVLIDAPTDEERRKNKQLAQQIYNARLGDLARERYDLPGARQTTTFAKLAEWYEAHELPKHRGAEREREILPRLVAAFGKLDVQAVTRRVVDEWVTRRLQERRTVNTRTFAPPSPSTVNRELDVLKAVLQTAVPDYLEASPLFGMKRLQTTTPKRRLMTQDEEEKVLEQLSISDRVILLLGLDTLIRLGDILDLRRRDDHGTSLWIADPKAGGGFSVPVSRRVRSALDDLYQAGTLEPDEWLFKKRRIAKTERDRRNGIRQMLETACTKAGVPYGRAAGGLTFHWATRRTGATRMLTRGIDPGTVQKVGRWKTAAVVLGIYHELLDDQAQRAVESVSQKPPKPDKKKKKRL